MKKIFILFISLITLSFSDGYSGGDDCSLGDLVNEEWFEKFIDDLESPGGEKLAEAFKKNPEIIDSWRDFAAIGKKVGGVPQGHALRKNVDFLEKYNALTDVQKDGMIKVYKQMSNPSGMKGRVDYTFTKELKDGRTITLKFDKNGFPEFEEFVPKPHNKFLYHSNDLGKSTDFAKANEAIAKNLGFEDEFIDGIPIQKTLDDGTVYDWTPGKNNFTLTKDGVTKKYTWHHHQDGRTLMPVESNVHSPGEGGFNHSGGESIIKGGLQEFFPPPNFN